MEGMRSAVDRLLQQSLQWSRIEMANQEKKTAMRTNKVRPRFLRPITGDHS